LGKALQTLGNRFTTWASLHPILGWATAISVGHETSLSGAFPSLKPCPLHTGPAAFDRRFITPAIFAAFRRESGWHENCYTLSVRH
jgi:hypothetical protein